MARQETGEIVFVYMVAVRSKKRRRKGREQSDRTCQPERNVEGGESVLAVRVAVLLRALTVNLDRRFWCEPCDPPR